MIAPAHLPESHVHFQVILVTFRDLFDREGYGKKIAEALVTGLPLGLVAAFQDHVKDQFIATPWKILWFALPLVALNTFAWIKLRPRGLRDLDWRVLLFCSLYCAMFALFSMGELFAWERVPRVSTDVAHENFAALLPVRWGDWRYWLIRPPKAADTAPIAVLLASHQNETRNQLRLRDLRSLDIASQGNIAGVALDISYTGPSGVDNLFCSGIARIEKKGVLVSAYELHDVKTYGYERIPKVDQQPRCLKEDHQGHSFGLADVDGLVRGIPLFWEGPERRHPALSWQFAVDLAKQGKKKDGPGRPADLFLRILPAPKGAVRIFWTAEQFKTLAEHPGVLSGDIVVMGDLAERDWFRTPFGKYPGAVLHAFAIYDLKTGYFMTRAPYFLSIALI
ncbi:MAG: putative Chase2 sensor protein, partial [Gammaproteobacteria bacterium]|nr:putative Chase2 sensor protein [Gammaproteobacteria bacterium]